MRVAVAYIHSDEVAHSWHESMFGLMRWDLEHDGSVMRGGGWIRTRAGTSDGVVAARNGTVRDFLAVPGLDWLFWVDTDMGFEPDTLDRLLAMADATERPIVGARCYMQQYTSDDGMGGYHARARATIYDWNGQGFAVREAYPEDALVQCAATGSACILIHRSVFERMEVGSWYDRLRHPAEDGRVLGEDFSFCLRAALLEIPIYVHTGVVTSHMKRVWISTPMEAPRALQMQAG